MKNLTSPMQSHLQQRVLTLANMWKLTRQDGVVMGFTDHDQPIDYDDGNGTITYEAGSGMTASALASSSELRVDTQDVAGILDSERINDTDLRAGKYDEAEVRFFKVNYEDPSTAMGDIKMKINKTGEVRMENDFFVVELRSLSQSYSQKIIDLIQSACGVDLGSAKCKVRLDPPEWDGATAYTEREERDAGTGSVVKPSVFNDRHFDCRVPGLSGSDEPIWDLTLGNETIDGEVTWITKRALLLPEIEVLEVVNQGKFWINYTGDAPDDLFTLGLVECITGQNIGLFREIKVFDQASDGPAIITTFLPFPFPVQGGVTSTAPDIFKITAGCEKTSDICKRNFDNIENYHGFKDVPGLNKMFLTPNAPG